MQRNPERPPMGEWSQRGVYVLPATGPAGEYIIFAVMSDSVYLVDSFTVIPASANHIACVDALWARLDAEDPIDAPPPASVKGRRGNLCLV